MSLTPSVTTVNRGIGTLVLMLLPLRHCLRQTRSVCARELATKLQSNFALKRRSNPCFCVRRGMDCFASLAMTGRERRRKRLRPLFPHHRRMHDGLHGLFHVLAADHSN